MTKLEEYIEAMKKHQCEGKEEEKKMKEIEMANASSDDLKQKVIEASDITLKQKKVIDQHMKRIAELEEQLQDYQEEHLNKKFTDKE